jgi:hypothetical protein
LGESELRVIALEARVEELEHRLRALAACVDELAAALALGRKSSPGAATSASQEASLAAAAFGGINTDQLPSGLRSVIHLVQAGDSERAQRDLYRLPEAELQAHQDVVTMIATALFIQRGDFDSAKKVLTSGVQATNDPRLQKLLTLLEQHYSG